MPRQTGGLRPHTVPTLPVTTPGCRSAAGWTPGPRSSAVAVLVFSAFCATSLTLDFAADLGFFLLSAFGVYVGFRRGFVRGLGASERLLMVAFAAFPAVAIICYLTGMQTDVGYRILGRDLRFFLFIPVYLALRWSFPRREMVGWAFVAGAAGSLASALVFLAQHGHRFRPQGVAGVAITFGDLSLLSGFVGAALLLHVRRGRALAGACVGIGAALAASVLSGSRGGWLAVPVLAVLIVLAGWMAGSHKLAAAVALVAVASIAVLAVVPGTPVASRGAEALRNVDAYFGHFRVRKASSVDRRAVCPNAPAFLAELATGIRQWSKGTPLPIRIVRDPKAFAGTRWQAICRSDYLYEVSKSPHSHGWTTLVIPRSVPTDREHDVGILAQGSALLRSADGAQRVPLRSNLLKETRAKLRLTKYQSVLISLRPGDSIRFVPLQLSPGSYFYFYAANPTGLRLEMWRAAWAMFVLHPFLGIGTGAFHAAAQSLVAGGRLAPGVAAFDHPHNDFMAALGEKGLVGFAALFGLLLVPLASFRARGKGRRDLGVAVLVSGWMVFGLSETMFVHSLAITWYVVATAGLIALGSASSDAIVDGPGASVKPGPGR